MAGSGRPVRVPRLRREWTRAFAVMLVALLVAGVATFAGFQFLIGQFTGAAHQLDRESILLDSLDTALVAHETMAHQLVNATPVDRSAFLAQQDAILVLFGQAHRTFPAGASALVTRASNAWQAAMTREGLWGDRVQTFTPPASGAPNQQMQLDLSGDNQTARALLGDLHQPLRDAIHRDLSADGRLEWALVGLRGVLFGLAIAVTMYYRRRMSRDLLGPVAALHEGVARLRAGEYGHRIAVVRHDELGELAEAFNSMAAALHDSHLALTFRATRDPLTGLANRAALTERLAGSFGPGRDRRACAQSVLFIDIDDFKDVNDSLGHDGGDALLLQLTARLNGCVRPVDLLARLGGDEFAVVLDSDDDGSGAVTVAERILKALSPPFLVDGTELSAGVSIGIARRHPGTADAAELLRNADFAMYMAKGAGKGRYHEFDPRLHDEMVRSAGLAGDLADARAAG